MSDAPHIIRIDSLDDPALRPYRTLRRPMDHREEGIFVAEGDKVVERLLGSSVTVVSILATDEWLERLRGWSVASRLAGLPIYVAPKATLEGIVGFHLHQGIMAVGRVPAERPLSELVQGLPADHLLVALDGLANAENVGVVVRNCAAFGVDALIVGASSSSPYLRRAVRNSMGTVFTLPIVHVDDLGAALDELRSRFGTAILGTTPAGATDLADAPLRGPCCLVLGSEGDGLPDPLLARCTGKVAIAMENGTDSLNVASASAVVLYEARRQRRK